MSELTLEALSDLQGIIMSGYGHLPCASFLFVQFHDASKGKAWVSEITSQLTTAKPWDVRPDGTKVKPETATNLAFTLAGLKALGLPPETLSSFPTEFRAGIVRRATILGDNGDSAPDKWTVGGSNNAEVHALLLLYAKDEDTRTRLFEAHQRLLQASAGGVVEVSAQHGSRLKSSKEHFGFSADGLSQPQIEGAAHNRPTYDKPIKTGEFILGYLNEFGLFPGSPSVPEKYDTGAVLPRFPDNAVPKCRDFGRHGTYIVYRKLEQDVAGFWQFIENSAWRLGDISDPEKKEQHMRLLAAQFMGRWPGGAPLTLAPTMDDPRFSEANDFTYRETDEFGYACPIGSHIRRSNPRDSILRVNDTIEESFKTTNQHRIIRRGLFYGDPLFPPEAIDQNNVPLGLQDDGQERGLHFFAINADIKRQFEFIQQTWINNTKFNNLQDSKDPIVGDNDGTTHVTIQCKPLRKHIKNVPRFVHVRGGGYFFMPSVTSLRFLAGE